MITGSIPTEIGNLSHLGKCCGNSGLPPLLLAESPNRLLSIPPIVQLDMSQTLIDGLLPNELGLMVNLRKYTYYIGLVMIN